MFRYFPVFLFMGALGGCASQSAQPAKPSLSQAMQHFQQATALAISQTVAGHADDELIGALRLRVGIDRAGKPLSCKTEPPTSQMLQSQPPYPPPSDPAALAAVVEKACWNTIYPIAPLALFGDKRKLTLVAPLQLQITLESSSDWPLRNAQQKFFHERLLATEQVASIGSLLVRYQTDARGDMQGCLVDLRPVHARPDAFRLDTDLHSRLNAACLKLNLSDMPGFRLNKEQQAVGTVALTYAPWTVGRQ